MEICDELTISKDENVTFLAEAGGFSSLKYRKKVTQSTAADIFKSIYLQHLPFVENFHGVNLICGNHSNNTDNSERSAANNFKNFKVIARKTQLLNIVHRSFH